LFRSIKAKAQDLKAEQKRSDRLVSQMLPNIVAENFKNNRQEFGEGPLKRQCTEIAESNIA
jgi:hypothetical protein